jgi:hypothetical protein
MKKKCMAVGGTAKKPATMEEQLAGIRGKVRPGYQAGGTVYRSGNSFTDQQIGDPMKGIAGAGMSGQVDNMLDRTKVMPNSIASPPQYGGSVIPAQTGQQAMQAATNFGMPPAGTAPTATSQTISTGDYSTGPRQGGFVDEYGRPRPADSTPAMPPAPPAPLMTMAEKETAVGLNPNRIYKPGSAADPMASGGGIAQAVKAVEPMAPVQDRTQSPVQQGQVGARRRLQRPEFAEGGIIDKLIRTVGRVLPDSNGERYEPGIQSRASEDPVRPFRAEALNPRTQTASSDTPPAGGFQEEAERRRKQMEEAKNYEAGGLITPVNLGQGLYQAIAQPIAEDWRQGNAAIKKVRDQYPTADSLAGINPFVAAAQVANDVAAGNVGGDTAINVAQAVPVIKGLSGMAKMLTKQAGPTIGATKFVIDMPNTVRKNVALTTGQTLGQPANAFAAGGMVRFSGKGGPRDDKIPVKVAGAEINVSNGENAVILPAKTAANPAALQAINGIIQATNDGRQPKMGMEDGGKYRTAPIPTTASAADGAGALRRSGAGRNCCRFDPGSVARSAKVVAPPGSVGGGMSSSGTDPRDIPEGGTITNLAPAFQQVTSPIRAAAGGIGQVFADSAQAQREGVSYQDIKQRKPIEQATPYSNEGRPSAMDRYALTPVYGSDPQGIASGMAQDSGARTKDGMTTTQMGRGFDPTQLTMADGYGMATNAAGKTISAGPSEYVGADGKPTSRWTDTQQYKDAIARNERDKIRLAEMQAVRLGANPQQALQASQGIAQSAQQAGQAAQQAGQAQQVQQFAIDKAAREQSLIDAWDKAGTPEQKQAIAGQLKIMRGQQDKEGQFDATKGGQTVDPATGQIIDLPPVIFNKSTGQPVQQAQSAQQAVPPADKRTVGQTYQTPKGPMIWRGNGWEAAR